MEETDSKNLTVHKIKSTDTMFIISKDAVFEATDELAKELLYDLFIFNSLLEHISEFNIDELKRMRNQLQEEINKLEIKKAIKENKGDNI